ncbi:MAG: hypothetical protein Tsb0013_21750 [Phycisphaerales bacterium]
MAGAYRMAQGILARDTEVRMLPKVGATIAIGVLVMSSIGGCRTGSSGARSNESIFELVAPPTPAEAAEMASDPFNPDRRQTGMLLLANAPFGGESVYIRLYEVALEDEDTGVQTVGVKALGLHGSPRHVAPIGEKLASGEDPVLRWEAARSLQRLHEPEAAIPALLEAMSTDDEADVRAACATALGQYAQPRVFDALVAALDDPSLNVNLAAQGALGVLTGQRLGSTPTPWLDWADSTSDLFADRGDYEYPVFQRDRRLAEWIVPWLDPPNETPAAPAGMAGEARRGGVDEG